MLMIFFIILAWLCRFNKIKPQLFTLIFFQVDITLLVVILTSKWNKLSYF